MLIVNEPFIGNAAGWMRDFAGSLSRAEHERRKGIHRVSAGVKAKQCVEHYCFTLLLLTN